LERQTSQPSNPAVGQGIEQAFLASGEAAPLQRALTAAADALILDAHEAALAPAVSQAGAILAVGDYGRGDLFPYSDIDILIVFENEPAQPVLHDALGKFTQQLWEGGVRPNHRVCTLAECLELREQSLHQGINLLDRRFVGGDRAIHEKIETRVPEFLTRYREQLIQRLSERTRARHAKWNDTPRHAEPDVKDAPGGLRDLYAIRRLAKLGIAAGADTRLEEAGAFLATARCFLHYRAREDRNLLGAGEQKAICEQPFAGGAAPSDWMRGYFRRARVIFNEARWAIEASAAGPAWNERDPEAVFAVLDSAARTGTRPPAEIQRRLEAAGDAVAECPWPRLKAILALPYAGAALRMLADLGLLAVVVPEWASIEGLIAADSGSRYTLDEHALIAIERLRELRETSDPARLRFAELLSGMEDQALLVSALLLHAADSETAAFLIERRSDLSDIASGRDLDDPATARLLADRAGTVERLRLLTTLTYADLAAGYPETMASWRLDQLWRVYQVTERELTRELETDRIQKPPESLSFNAGFIEGFPVRYLRARTAGEIERHARLYDLSRASGAALEIDRTEGAYKLTVVARDRAGLFASFAGALSSFGLNILKAEAFANSQGMVLDTFVFADPKRTLELNPPEIERLEDMIRRVATGKTEARRLLRNLPQPDPSRRSIAPQVRFDSDACETATLVEIVTEDRPGLLYSLASAFFTSDCNIDVVLIDTKGRCAVDVFYVAREGRKLSPDFQAVLRERLLAAC
jgi:[protein-PII] uridylyltransferase